MKQMRTSQRAAGWCLALLSVTGLWAQQQPIRITSGLASSNYTAADGTVWLTDRYFSGGDGLYTRDPIGNTSDRYLYATARQGLYNDFEYNIPVANGSYNVTLKFAEIQFWNKGARIFNVVINGNKVLNNFDIMAEVPTRTVLDKTFPVDVTGGKVRIQFVGVVGRGLVSAIQIAPNAAQPVTISVNPAQVSVAAGQSTKFTAAVGGTANTAVTWTASAGTVAADGTYTAPANVTQATAATVTATCKVDASRQATAKVSINSPVKVAVSPASGSVTAGLTMQLTASVTGTSDSRVTWSASTGTISSTGLFTAPNATVPVVASITAKSVADPAVSAIAQITVNPISGNTTPVWQESSGQVVMEAEKGTIINRAQSWLPKTSLAGFSGTSYLSAEPVQNTVIDSNYATVSPEVQFKINVQTPGYYTFWVRGYATAGHGSVHVGLDGDPNTPASRIVLPAGQWSWSSTRMNGAGVAYVHIPAAGPHTVNVWMREDGFAFDKLVMCISTSYVPSGMGPGESPYAGSPGPGPTPPPASQPVLAVSTGSLTFNAQAGGSNPAAQSVNISNTGTGTLSWTASKGQGWLTLSAASGTAPSALSVGVALGSLAAGTYTDVVTVNGAGASKPVNVTLNVTAAPVVTPPPPTGSASAGRVLVTKRTQPDFNTYTESTNPAVWQWMRDHYYRMIVFSPYFNSKTSQYGNGWIYKDSYAIYSGDNSHPEWVLKDAAGNWLYIPYACGGGTCPQYAADISNPAFRQAWVDSARAALAAGTFKGLWIDDVNLDWRVGNGSGNFVNPIDRNTGQPMTLDNWRRYFAEFMEKVRRDLPGYEITHNSIWYVGGDSGRDANPYIKRQILAADTINIEFGVNDGGLGGGTGDWSCNAVLGFIDRVNALGKRIVIEGIAGGNANDQVGLEYAVANYFLVSNGQNAVGDYANVTTPDRFWAGFNVNLGTPSGGRYSWNGLNRRDFSSGMTLVNEPGAPTRTVTLPGTYRKVDGTAVTSVTLGAKQGIVLTK